MDNWQPVNIKEYPPTIRIGAVDYVLQLLPEGSTDWGECDSVNSIISVSGKLTAGRFALTLLHEIFHALIEEYGILEDSIDATEKDEEGLVVRLSTGLAVTMQNNQFLFYKIISTLDASTLAKYMKEEKKDGTDKKTS